MEILGMYVMYFSRNPDHNRMDRGAQCHVPLISVWWGRRADWSSHGTDLCHYILSYWPALDINRHAGEWRMDERNNPKSLAYGI
jgi:hypothetical protein